MPETKVTQLNRFGQSVWLDNINRRMIETGKLKEWIGLGLRGMTSNPSIFDNAISKSNDYDNEIKSLSKAGKSAFEIYDELTVKDIQDAADMYKAIYDESDGLDGYVSLEVNPKLARKTQETIDEAMRLYERVDRANVMFNSGGGLPTVTNCILWGDGDSLVVNNDSTAAISFSTVRGGCDSITDAKCGAGTLSQDPLLVDGDADDGTVDLRLQPGSPCIDRGNDQQASATDKDGNPHYDDPNSLNCDVAEEVDCDWISDIGAYEFQG